MRKISLGSRASGRYTQKIYLMLYIELNSVYNYLTPGMLMILSLFIHMFFQAYKLFKKQYIIFHRINWELTLLRHKVLNGILYFFKSSYKVKLE